jgi:NitT/TauT family transport system permease protein
MEVVNINHHLKMRTGTLLVQAGTVVAFVCLWQVLATRNIINASYFPPPTKILATLKEWNANGTLWRNVGSTVTILMSGWILGTAIGVVIGVPLGLLPTFRGLFEPIILFLNAVPRLILFPVFAIWFGFGTMPKIVFVITVVVVVVAINIAAGIQEVSTNIVNHTRVIGASPIAVVRLVYLPAVVLWVISTARMTVGYAFNAAVAAEFTGASLGLGYLISQGQFSFNSGQVYAAMVITVCVALVLDITLSFAERKVTRWMP